MRFQREFSSAAFFLGALAVVGCSADNLLDTTLRENIAARQGAVITNVIITNASTSTASTQNTATVSFQLSESGKYSVAVGACDSGSEVVGKSSADAGNHTASISASALSSGANSLKICYWEPVRGLLSDSYAVTLNRDDAAPTIVSTTPAHNAVRADTDTNVTIVFSEPVVLPADTATGITVSNNQGNVAGVATLNSSGETLTFQPTVAFGYTKNIEVQILAGITDRAGNAVATTTRRFATRFTIQDGTLGSDMAFDLAIDAFDNIFISGGAEGSIDGQPYQSPARDSFFIKMDRYGQRIFTRMIGSSNTALNGNDSFTTILPDNAGNVYVAGESFGTSSVTFDGINKIGSTDIVFMKYSDAGAKISTELIGSTSGDTARKLVQDSLGNIYILGHVRTAATLIDGQSFLGDTDIMIRKYDASGTKLFTKILGSTALDSADSLVIDSTGNLYVGIYTQGSMAGTNLDGNSDICLVKLDSSGNELWRTQINNSGTESIFDMLIDNTGSIWACGYSTQSFDGNSTLGSSDLIVAKFSPGGTKLFSRQYGSDRTDYCDAIAKDSAGNIYIAGTTSGNLAATNSDPSQSSADVFLMKIDSNGNAVWQRQFGGSASDDVFAMKINSQNEIFIAGRTTSNLDGNILKSASKFDFYLMKFDISGILQ